MRMNGLGAFAACAGLLAGAAQAHAISPSTAAPKGAAVSQKLAPAKSAVAPSAGMDAAQLKKGDDLFSTYTCGGCHTLLRAGATGRVGPSFDGNANLDKDYIVDRVTNGSGMMPPFGGQMSQADITTVAAYILTVKAK
jgi:mono/diheme cytochrome c family protein